MSSSTLFQDLHLKLPPQLQNLFPKSRLRLLDLYYGRVVEGNKVQNLTRIIDAQDFWDSNVLDVLRLLSMKDSLGIPVDLGSGAGVPGLLYETISSIPCILLESEGMKAAFLSDTVHALGLKSTVFSGRAEDFFNTYREPCWIMSRATANVSKIWNWTRKCSTWNNITLFKSRNWEKEWQEFEDAYPAKLKITEKIDYVSGSEEKFRTIVKLERNVPRGTIKNN